MTNKVNFFNRHLTETGEGFFEHFAFASLTAAWLALASLILLIHAFFPFLFTVNASKHVKKINQVMQKRVDILIERRKKNTESNAVSDA